MRHRDVEENYIPLFCTHHLQRFNPVCSFAANRYAMRFFQNSSQPLAHDGMVINNKHPDQGSTPSSK
jgi:hypothetical protein